MLLFALFLIVPMIEIALFIVVGGWLSLWPTLGLVILNGVIGVALMRWQGMKVVAELRGDMGQLQNPLSPMAHGALILLAGMLLVIPGFFTDAVGFLLMVPQIRALVIRLIGSRIKVQTMGRAPTGATRRADGPIILDGEFYEIEEKHPPQTPSGWTRH